MTEQTTPDAGVSQADSSSDEAILSRLQNFNAQFDENQAPEAEQRPSAVAEQSPATSQPEAEAQADDVTVDDLPSDPPADADAFEIVHNGAQVQLNRADTIKYAQQGFDYDRKTQALAEERKSLAERAKLLRTYEQMVPHLTQDKAQVDALGAQLQQYQNVNWVQLAQQNPGEYPVLRAQYDQMVGAYQAAVNRLGQKQQVVHAQFSQALAQQQAKERAALQERIPQWKDQATFQKEAPVVTDYMLREYGFTAHEIDNLYDSRVVAAFVKAQKYDALQRAKADKVKQLRAAPPVTRPNAANSGQAGSDRSQQLTKRLQRTGDVKDAAALLMERWK